MYCLPHSNFKVAEFGKKFQVDRQGPHLVQEEKNIQSDILTCHHYPVTHGKTTEKPQMVHLLSTVSNDWRKSQ